MSHEEIDLEKITLADIENMLKILEKFLRISKRAERIVKVMSRYYTPTSVGGDIFQTIIRESFRTRTEEQLETEETELTEDELRTLEKIKRGKAKQIK